MDDKDQQSYKELQTRMIETSQKQKFVRFSATDTKLSTFTGSLMNVFNFRSTNNSG